MVQSECISWTKCTSWLTNFLSRRGLRQPDGRPLYEYQATNEEYVDLTQLLRAVSQTTNIVDYKGYASCFVFFALNGTAETMSGIVGGLGSPFTKS